MLGLSQLGSETKNARYSVACECLREAVWFLGHIVWRACRETLYVESAAPSMSSQASENGRVCDVGHSFSSIGEKNRKINEICRLTECGRHPQSPLLVARKEPAAVVDGHLCSRPRLQQDVASGPSRRHQFEPVSTADAAPTRRQEKRPTPG